MCLNSSGKLNSGLTLLESRLGYAYIKIVYNYCVLFCIQKSHLSSVTILSDSVSVLEFNCKHIFLNIRPTHHYYICTYVTGHRKSDRCEIPERKSILPEHTSEL